MFFLRAQDLLKTAVPVAGQYARGGGVKLACNYFWSG
jgi:hypothetical protein